MIAWNQLDIAAGYVERGLVLRPLQPSVSFRTLILFPTQKKSKIVADLADALLAEKNAI